MRALLCLILACALACGSSPRAPVVHNQQPERADYAVLLREIGVGAAEEEALERAYVARGSDALLFAANTLLDPAADEPRARGARRVLMTLDADRDFTFLLEFRPTPSADTSCSVSEVFWLAAQSVRDGSNMPIVEPLARRLVRALDEPWTTCVTRIAQREPGYSHVHATALEILDEMFEWSDDFDGSLARCWDECGPAHVTAFKRWWRKHAPLQ